MAKQKVTHIYNQKTAIRDVMDRLDYITRPERQQEKLILAVGNMNKEFWRRLAKKNRQESKNTKRTKTGQRGAVEAIEIIMNLPNDILRLSCREQMEIMESLHKFTLEKTGTDCVIGLHNSHEGETNKPGNAHVHILIADRPLLPQTKKNIATDRNIFLDEKGKRHRTKKEILNPDGSLRPGCRIIKKGERWKEDDIFGAKYSHMSTKHWLHRMKQNYAYWLNETLQPDLVREVYNPETSLYIPYFHIHKGFSDEKKKQIEKENRYIRAWNNEVRDGNIIFEDEAKLYRALVALSPNKVYTFLKLYQKIDNKVNTNRAFSAEDILKEQKREEYRLAHINRKLAAEAKTKNEKNKYQKIAAGHSANIDRIDRALGNWKPEKYYEEIRKSEIELEKLTTQAESFRYWMMIYAQKRDEESQRRWTAYRRMLWDIEDAQKALAREIAANKERWALAEYDESKLKKISLDGKIKSSQVRKEANEVMCHDFSKPADTYFGPANKKAQAMIDAIEIYRKENISDENQRQRVMDNIAVSMISRKSAVETTTKVLDMMEQKRQLVIEYEQLQREVAFLGKIENEEEKRYCREEYRPELERLEEIRRLLESVGIYSEESRERFKKLYNRILNENEKNKRELKQLEKEYLHYRNIRNTFITARGGDISSMEEGNSINYALVHSRLTINIDYDHIPPEKEKMEYDWEL